MIAFIVEKGNRKTGYKSLGIMSADQMFELVYATMPEEDVNKKIIRQWQEAEYTYIDYGNRIDFFRYKAAFKNIQEKEAD